MMPMAAHAVHGGLGRESAAPAVKQVLDTFWALQAQNDPSIVLPVPLAPTEEALP